MSYRLLKSSFFLVQSMGGALLLERFWCASSLTCCRDMLSAGMVSAIKPCGGKKKTSEMMKESLCAILGLPRYWHGRTSGGVFAGGVPSEVLDEALDGEGLTDSFEFLSGSVALLLFTWEHNHSSIHASVNVEYQE